MCPPLDFEVYLKTKIDKASQIDPMMMHIHQTTSEKGFPTYHHHHQNVRTNGVPHNQFGQQPLRPGFVLPPKYMSREEYSSVKSIGDSVYFTPLTNGTSRLGGAAGGEDEDMSQKSIQGTPIHINYLPESLDIPEDIQMMYHEMKPLESSSEERQSKRRDKRQKAAEKGGMWSDNPERLCGGGDGDDAAVEEMMMRMSFGRLGNLDEDTSEILLHELIQKKLKRDRRNRMRFYDERRRQERLKAAGGNVVAEQGMIEGNSSGHAHGVGDGAGLALLPKFRGKGSSRRPVLASAMDPEFLRLMNGGDKGIPLHDDDNRRGIRSDYHQRTVPVPPMRVVEVNEDEGVQQQKPQKKCSNGGVMKADILYHSISVEPEPSTSTTTSRQLAGGVGGELGAKPKTLVEKKPNFNGWHHREQDTEEEDDDDAGDRFSQRQMFTSKSLPEISRKRGGGKKRNKDHRVAVEDEEEESGALLGVSSATAAKSSIQMATIEPPPRPSPPATHQEQQTANTINSNFTATGGSTLMNCENNNSRAGRGVEDELVMEIQSVGGGD